MIVRNTSDRALAILALGRVVEPGATVDVGDLPGFDGHPLFETVEPAETQEAVDEGN